MNIQDQFQPISKEVPTGFNTQITNSNPFQSIQPVASNIINPPQVSPGFLSSIHEQTSSTSFAKPLLNTLSSFIDNSVQPSLFSQTAQRPFGTQSTPLFSSPKNLSASQPSPFLTQTTNQESLNQELNNGNSHVQANNILVFGNTFNTPAQQSLIQPSMKTGLLFGGGLKEAYPSLFSMNRQQNNTQPLSLFEPSARNSLFGGATMSSLGNSLFGNVQSQAPYYTPTQQAKEPLFSSNTQPRKGSLFSSYYQRLSDAFTQTEPSLYCQTQASQTDKILDNFRDNPNDLCLNSLLKALPELNKEVELSDKPKNSSLLSQFPYTSKSTDDVDTNKCRQNIDKSPCTPKSFTNSLTSRPIEEKEEYAITEKASYENLKPTEYKDFDSKTASLFPNSPNCEEKTEIIVVVNNIYPVRMNISATSSTTIKEIRSKVLQHVRWIEDSGIQLMFKSKILQDSDTVKSLNMICDDIINVVVTQEKVESKQIFAPANLLPKLKRPGYFTTPSMIELARMTTEELKSVKNFTVENQFGKIVFDGETNVTSLDLDELIKIEWRRIEVMSVKRNPTKSATIYLYRYTPKKNIPDDIFREKLIKKSRGRIEFVSWDSASKIFVFKVKHILNYLIW